MRTSGFSNTTRETVEDREMRKGKRGPQRIEGYLSKEVWTETGMENSCTDSSKLPMNRKPKKGVMVSRC